MLQIGQQVDALLLGSRLPHDLAAVNRLALTVGFAGRAVGQEIRCRERSRMRPVGIQRMHQCRTFLNDPHPGVAMAVDPPLVALGQAKPPLQIEIIPDRFILLLAHEQAGKEAEHRRRHPVPDRILGRLELIDQRLELLLPLDAIFGPGLQRRGHHRDHIDVFPDDLLLLLDSVQPGLDASGQAAELRLCEPPFFASKFRRSDWRTSVNASAILSPGG